jgi:mannose-6-phosphate isomerase-like protein (cupin superfamily)
MELGKVNLAAKLGLFHDHWRPRTVALFNKHDIMVVKVQGEFTWHKHDNTDDFFLVLDGQIQIRLRDQTVVLNAGELFVVPRGVEHQPYAEREASILLIEPTGTPNSGDPATAAPRQEL